MERTLLTAESPKENPRTTPSVVEDYPHFLPVFTGLSSTDRGWRGLEAVRFKGQLKGESVLPHTHHVAMVYLGRPLEMRAKMGRHDQYRHLIEGDVTIVPAGMPSEWGWRGEWSVDCLHMYVGLGVGIFHLSSAAIFAYVGFSRRNSAIIRGLVAGLGVLLLLSGLVVALTVSFLGFPFEGRGWEAGLVQAALGGLTMACAVVLPCDDEPTIS